MEATAQGRDVMDELTELRVEVATVKTEVSGFGDRLERLENTTSKVVSEMAELTAILKVIAKLAKPALVLPGLLGLKMLGSEVPWDKVLAALFGAS